MTQPKALYLADVLEHKAIHENGTMLEMSCAAKLRRYYAENEALLEALKEIVDAADGTGWDQLDASFSKARAAIKAAEIGRSMA